MSNSFQPLTGYSARNDREMLELANSVLEIYKTRRTVRDFSDQPVDLEIIKKCVAAAATAPSGANQQPWHFAIVSDPAKKKEIREKAEVEEREFYEHRAPETWLQTLAPLGTDANKPFLETAPHLIVVFGQTYQLNEEGESVKNYYVSESVGIATGMLISALHQSGLATLTHTPSPMKFLNQILDRPKEERPFLILVTGHPAEEAVVPVITKKPFDEIASLF